jgi:apolipoprotein N-acyltransferase
MTQARPPAVLLARLTGWRAAAVAFAVGAVAGLGQAPFSLWLAAPLGLACLAVLIAIAPDRRAATIRAWAGGAGHFALSLHWIVEPFFVDAARHGWMAPFALILFAGGLALFWAAAGWASHWSARSAALRALAFAPALVLSEAARGSVLTGFPWAFPGHALIDTPWLGLSSLAGAHGLTLVVAGVASIWAASAITPRGWPVAVGAAALLFVPWVLPSSEAPVAGDTAPVVRLIQPNAPQHLKWLPDMVPVFWQRGRDLTARAPDPALGAPELVIWPETSLPVPLGRSDAARLQLSVAAADAPVLIGAQRIVDFSARNSLALVGPSGSLAAVYDKHHLVPFGEYLPFEGIADRFGIRALAAVLPGGYGAGGGPLSDDLLRGDLPRLHPGCRRAARLDGACHQRRVVRHVLRPLAAPRAGPPTRRRAGAACAQGGQYRRVRGDRCKGPCARRPAAGGGGVSRHTSATRITAHGLRAFRRWAGSSADGDPHRRGNAGRPASKGPLNPTPRTRKAR